MTCYEFEDVFYPDYLKLDKNDENAWEVYAETVRSLMGKCMNMPLSKSGYTEKKEYETGVIEDLNKLYSKKKT